MVDRFVISRPRLKSFTRPTVKRDIRGIIRCLSCFLPSNTESERFRAAFERISNVAFVAACSDLSLDNCVQSLKGSLQLLDIFISNGGFESSRIRCANKYLIDSFNS